MKRQKGIPIEMWPGQEGEILKAALALASRRRDQAKKLTERTVADIVSAYGCALSWLADRGRLQEDVQPEDRWPAEVIFEMTDDMGRTHAPATISARLWGLKKCLSLMQQRDDLTLLADAIASVDVKHRPVRPIIRKVSISDLTQLGLDIVQEAECASGMDEMNVSFARQTGLQIALLSRRPWRASAFARMKIGIHVRCVGATWRLFATSQTQAKRDANASIPDGLIDILERHLRHDREILRHGRDVGSAVWLRPFGQRFEYGHLYYWVKKHTTQRFGEPITPHDFRRIAATTIARDHPKIVHITPTVLGHSQPRTSEDYYEMADSMMAFTSLCQTLDDLRRHARGRKR